MVYGGGSVGLMGIISHRVYDGGCDVLGYVKFIRVQNIISYGMGVVDFTITVVDG